MKKTKMADLAILLTITALAALVSLLLKANFFISTLLLFGLPSLFLSYKNFKAIKKTAIFSFLITVPFTLLFDYLISVDRGWHIVSTVFNFRLFGIVALEQFIWAFLWVYQIIVFYEYFLDQQKTANPLTFLLKIFSKKTWAVTKRMEVFSIVIFAGLLGFISFVLINPVFIKVGYAYFWLGLIFGVVPLSIFLIKFPNFWKKFIIVTVYFFFMAIIVEFIGLKLNHWAFPGNHYIGVMNFFGFRIPLEEIILYFFISTPAILSYYEFLDDDRK